MSVALLGRQTPRIQLAPDFVHNAGDEAVDFAERIGLPLDEWQKLGLRNGLGWKENGQWAAFEVCVICQRQNGKGAITEALELTALFVWGLSVVIHSAHRLDTSRAAFRRIKSLIERNPDLSRRCKPINDSDEHIEMIGGGRLEFRTRTRSGGRGLTCDLLVLDEALELTDEQIAAIVPTLAARPNAQIWYTSTVPEFADQHLCKVRAAAMAGAPRLAYCEWGVDKGANLGDPAVHAEANPAYGTRLTGDRLADLRRILGDAKFSTECCGIWPELQAGGVLDPARWETLLDIASKRDGDIVLMPDITPMRDHTTIGMFGMRADGLEHMQLLDYREGASWLLARMVELHETLDPMAWVIDDHNGAFALIEDLATHGITVPEDPEKPHRGAILILNASGAASATGQFIDAFRAKPSPLRHIGDQPLNDAIKNVKARPIGDGLIGWGRKISDIDIGPVVSVGGARYCYRLWKPIIGQPAFAAPATARAATQTTGSIFRPTSRLKL